MSFPAGRDEVKQRVGAGTRKVECQRVPESARGLQGRERGRERVYGVSV